MEGGVNRALCTSCGEPRTDEEILYFDSTCAACEEEWLTKIEDWRHGRTVEPELDAYYGAPSVL